MKTMKAAVFHGYGLNVLRLEEVPVPVPADGEVLLQVKAVAINDWDWGMLQVSAYLRALTPDGTYVTVGGDTGRVLGEVLVVGSLYSLFSRKKFRTVMLQANKSLTYINNLYEERKLKPVIDGPYPLSELPEQMQRFGRGEHKGKIVIEMGMVFS